MRRVVFLVNKDLGHLGSSALRGDQLCRMGECGRWDDRIEFRLSHGEDAFSDSLVFMTKGYCMRAKRSDLEKIKIRHNKLFADILDLPMKNFSIEYFDGLITSSLSQHQFVAKTFPKMRAFYIPHHVDLRIPPYETNPAGFRCAYFGDPDNALLPVNSSGAITVIPATTAYDFRWIRRLPDFNCHYAIRGDRASDCFKPFTKGFIAAHVGAAIVVDKADNEAAMHLGDDYPLAFDVRTIADSLECLGTAAAIFGSSEWQVAMSRMNRMREQFSLKKVLGQLESFALQ